MAFHQRVGAREVVADTPVDGPGVRFTLPSTGIETLQAHSSGLTWSWILDGFFAYGDSENVLRDGGTCNALVGATAEMVHFIVLPEASEIPIIYVALDRGDLTVRLNRDAATGLVLRAELMFINRMFIVVADGALEIANGEISPGDRLHSLGAFLERYAPSAASRSLDLHADLAAVAPRDRTVASSPPPLSPPFPPPELPRPLAPSALPPPDPTTLRG